MADADVAQRTFLAVYPTIRKWADGFFVSKRAQGIADSTLNAYRHHLAKFINYCETRNITEIEAIDAGLIREFLLFLKETYHNPGGVRTYYRSVKCFLRWYEVEAEPEGWRNPIKKVKSPKVPEEILEPAAIDDVMKMVETCDHSKRGLRDKAILLTLLDTGARASELIAFDLTDLDPITGEMMIRKGKGGKPRTVFVGQRARKAIRAYLKRRGALPGALFLTRSDERLDYDGLRIMVRRRADLAGISPRPTPHSFRRAFALEMLRSGADLLTVQRLLGHADLSVIKRYVKQTTDDLRAVHAAHSPADRAGL